MSELQRSLSTDDVVRIYRSLDLFWARLAVHIRAEHLVLFPAIQESLCDDLVKQNTISGTLKDLRLDHDFFIKELSRAVKAMRLVADFGNEPETIDIVRGFVEGVVNRLNTHNSIEEEEIYPLTRNMGINNEAEQMIVSRIQADLENMPARFQSLE